MKVQNIKTSQIRYPQSAEIKTSNSVTIPAQLTDEKNSGSKILYYKDCFFNKNISFSGKQNQDSPINKAELKNKLIKYDSYNDNEINTILAMIDTILEYDRWEETDESILCEMFDSLANSRINSDVKTMEYVTKKICDLEQEDDYVEINPVCKGISAICSNLKADDYRFNKIFIDGYSGFLSCSDIDGVFKLCGLLKNSIKNVSADKYARLLDVFNHTIKTKDEKLNNVLSVTEEFVSKAKYKDEELLDALLMHYEEKIPVKEIKQKLELRKAVSLVYNALELENKPDVSFFEMVFAAPIEELTKRNYTPKQIACLLSNDNFCHKIITIENIKKADPVIMADFIEDIPKFSESYKVMRKYTENSKLFNALLTDSGGNLDNPETSIEEPETGRKYSASEAKAAIIELGTFLDTCRLKRDMTVYRGEGIEVLNQIMLENGELLGDAINTAVKKKNFKRLDEITAEIIGSLIIQPHFMSSAYSKGNARDFIKHEGGIIWQIDAPKGANAIYADPFNIEHGLETEILFNRKSSLLIKDAKFEDGIYNIYADLIC